MNPIQRLGWLGASVLVTTGAQAIVPVPVPAFVTIVADQTDSYKWPREQRKWDALIRRVGDQVEKTEELIALTGEPAPMGRRLVPNVGRLMEPAEQAIQLETRQEALRTAQQRYHLNTVAAPTYNEANKVSAQYRAFGNVMERQERRYAHFAQQEAMHTRHKQAAEQAEKVERHEVEVQRAALDALRTAKTHADLGVIQVALAASKQRVDQAHAKVAQAAVELDAFRGQLAFEEQRKNEADREWTETVIARMREKALAGYRAQIGGGL